MKIPRGRFETFTAAQKALNPFIQTLVRTWIRECPGELCSTKYFLTTKRNRILYCSTQCANQAQSQWRKEWWTKHGKEWRRKRRSS